MKFPMIFLIGNIWFFGLWVRQKNGWSLLSTIVEEEKNGDYDLIMGPVANDQLYVTIRLYEQRVVTAEAAIEMLKAHKLFNQLSFHTVTVALLLKFVESIEVG